MSVRYRIYAEGINPTITVRFTILVLLTIALMAGCASQPRVVEVEVTAEPQVNVVEVTATPEPTTEAPEPATALSLVDSGQNLGEGRSWDVSLGDLDGDGDLDAFVVDDGQAGSGNAVWLNDGHGSFTISKSSPGYGRGLDLGDLDGDGDLDAFVTNWEKASQVWLNDGGAQGGMPGTFSDSGQRLGDGGGFDVALGDLDGDGDLDAFVAQMEANTVWLNDGGVQGGTLGVFSDTGQRLGIAITAAVVLGDLDGDGDLDALAGGWDEPAKVWLNDGTGGFTDSGHDLSPANIHIHGIALGDVDGDGDLDAFMAIASGDPNEVWLNDGDGVFEHSGQSLRSALAHNILMGDLDGDGDLDALMAIGRVSGSKVWLNDGGIQAGTPGFFTDSGLSLGDLPSYAVGLGDLDDDGDLDAFVTHADLIREEGGGEPDEVWLNETVPSPTSGGGGSGEIAFVSERDGTPQIYLVKADGSGTRQLTGDMYAQHWYPGWSSDGARIALHAHHGSRVWSIHTMNADGSDHQRLTDNDADDWWPDWSPDGTQIAFESNRDGNFEIYMMNTDGSNPRRLTDNRARDMMPAWRP